MYITFFIFKFDIEIVYITKPKGASVEKDRRNPFEPDDDGDIERHPFSDELSYLEAIREYAEENDDR